MYKRQAVPLLGSLGIAIGYAVIVGWVLKSVWGSITGEILITESKAFFTQMASAFGNVPWHLIVVAVTVLILSAGVLKGIEKINKIMMPAFFILFLIIAVRVAFRCV